MDVIWNTFFASGYILKMALFGAAALAVVYLHGVFWAKQLKIKVHWMEFFGLGLVSVLALEELVGWPFVAFRLPTLSFTLLTLCVILVPAALAAFMRPGRGFLASGMSDKRPDRILAAVGILIILVTAAISAFEYKANNDDALYVSNIALFKVSSNVNPYDASMGDVTTKTIPMYDFETWEALLSVICRIFNLKATETAHTLVIIPLFLCSASAFFALGRTLLGSSRKAWVFLIGVTLFHWGCRGISSTEGSFLLKRLWQGKTVNLCVVLPILSAAILGHFEQADSDKSRLYVIGWLCVLAGMALNPTSLYINGFELLFLSLAAALMHKNIKKTLPLLPCVVLTLVFTLMVYLRTRSGAGIVEEAGVLKDSFFTDAFSKVLGEMKVFLVMYFGALIYIFVRGPRQAKIYFLLTAALMLIFLWNPVAGRFVASKITKAPTYWRVFWLLPIGPGIAWCAADLTDRMKGLRAASLGVALMCLLSYAGEWNMANYVPAVNVEKIEPIILQMGNRLVKDKSEGTVLACTQAATTLRQEYTDIVLVVSKEGFIDDVYTAFGREEEGSDRQFMYQFANNALKEDECEGVSELLDKYNVRCVILRVGNKVGLAYMKALKWKLKDKGDGYMMYCRP